MSSAGSSKHGAADPGASAPGIAHQADGTQRRRLRWRARRGLLENDLLLTRFLDQHEAGLTDRQVAGLDCLLDLPDNELLDLILERTQLTGDGAEILPPAAEVLQLLRLAPCAR